MGMISLTLVAGGSITRVPFPNSIFWNGNVLFYRIARSLRELFDCTGHGRRRSMVECNPFRTGFNPYAIANANCVAAQGVLAIAVF